MDVDEEVLFADSVDYFDTICSDYDPFEQPKGLMIGGLGRSAGFASVVCATFGQLVKGMVHVGITEGFVFNHVVRLPQKAL